MRSNQSRWLIALLLSASFATQAQDFQLEQIVVTAQKRPEDLQATTISLLPIDRDQLERGNVTGVPDLRQLVPGLQMQPHPNAEGTLRLYLRGIGNSDEQLTQDPSVGLYSDGVYIPRNQGLSLELADLERVEVLRGPQGTLYGRNATGGAINLISAKPDSDSFRIAHQIRAGSRHLLRNRTSINLPLGETLAARLNHVSNQAEGFVRNAGTGASRFGDRDRKATRLDLLWQPFSGVSARYIGEHSDLEDSPAFIGQVPLNGDTVAPPSSGSDRVDNLQNNAATLRAHSLTLEWQMSQGMTLRSISALRELEDTQYQDFHAGIFGPLSLLKTSAQGEHRQRSQELQLLGTTAAGRVSYIAGYYWFLEEAVRSAQNFTPGNGLIRLVTGRDIQNRSRALFGQISWVPNAFSDHLTLTLGARRSLDDRRAILEKGTLNTRTGQEMKSPVPSVGLRDFSNTSPALTASWELRTGTHLYGKIERGYKSGGFNARASSVARFNEGFDDEILLSRELGLKTETWSRRLRVNLAAFHADYRDIQINVQSDPQNIVLSDVLNAGRARILGAELDVDVLLSASLQASARYANLAPKLLTVRNASGDNVASDYRLMAAPRHAVHLEVEKNLADVFRGELSAAVQYSWQSRTFGSATLDAGRYVIDAYGIINARVDYRIPLSRYTLEMSAWARNLGDTHYYLAHFNGGAGTPVSSAYWGDPRSLGVDLTFRY